MPYSDRQTDAHRAHVISELTPRFVAAAMGHFVETHLASSNRWRGNDSVANALSFRNSRASQRLSFLSHSSSICNARSSQASAKQHRWISSTSFARPSPLSLAFLPPAEQLAGALQQLPLPRAPWMG